jgi:hypothetical protein
MISNVITKLLQCEEKWCKLMSYFNPYIDPFKAHLTSNMPVFDGRAYEKYPEYNFVYDKLWIIKSQGLMGGKLEDLKGKEEQIFKMILSKGETDHKRNCALFIKPRWGHLSASSKNCFKINDAHELKKYIDYKNMMWSEFIDANEGMTDYIMLKGKIVHQITYIYSEKQNGFTDDWKYISPDSKPPSNITEWVTIHLPNYTGVVNVQYRDSKIIEVGLRLARAGAYLLSTENSDLIKNVNNIFDKPTWDFSLQNKLRFKPFYVFKCFTTLPIVYLFPQHVLDYLVKTNTHRPFYEYYFEPAGKEGMVFLQFMDDDFKRGMQTKEKIQFWFNSVQFIAYSLIILLMVVLFFQFNYIIVALIILLLCTRYLNPMMANYNLYKAQRQALFGGGLHIVEKEE